MADVLKLGIVLMLVAVIAAGSLGFVNSLTEPLIAQQKEKAKLEAMESVAVSIVGAGVPVTFDSLSVPGLANPYAQSDAVLSVVGVFSEGHKRGYVFIAYGRGYSSTIQTMVACGLNGEITASEILYQQETPGLGANVSDPDRFLVRFTGRNTQSLFLTADGGDIDAITGSTITSRAVTLSVRRGMEAMAAAGLFQEGGQSR
jgi:electron transport complex protein RnfG